MKTVYIETSVVSYLTALPARDVLAAAWRNATVEWWRRRRSVFDLFTSQLVLDEADHAKRVRGPRICLPGNLHTSRTDGRRL